MLLLLLMCKAHLSFAQRPDYPVMQFSDTIHLVPEASPLHPMPNPVLLPFDTDIFAAPLLTTPIFNRQLLPERGWQNLLTYDGNYWNPSFLFPGISATFPPFISSARVFHHAAYRVNEKFTWGGNSFGANSIHSLSRGLPGSDSWDTRGASMFMEYKVNRNFRIETRISVTGNHFP